MNVLPHTQHSLKVRDGFARRYWDPFSPPTPLCQPVYCIHIGKCCKQSGVLTAQEVLTSTSVQKKWPMCQYSNCLPLPDALWLMVDHYCCFGSMEQVTLSTRLHSLANGNRFVSGPICDWLVNSKHQTSKELRLSSCSSRTMSFHRKRPAYRAVGASISCCFH